MKKKFETTIFRDESMCFIPIPFDPKPIFGRARPPVKVTLNGYTFRSTISAMSNGPCIPFRKSNREAARLEGGETLPVTLELDEDERVVEPPKDLVKALKASPPAWDRWRELSFTHQREHAEAIEDAKKPETRLRRIEKSVEMLLGRAPKKTAAKNPAAKKSAPKKTAAKKTAPEPPPGFARYAAMLRGVSPMSCKMSALKAALEKHGFTDVATVITSGNVLFTARSASEASIEAQCEAAMAKHMDRTFLTIVRRVDDLRALIAADPFAPFAVESGEKRNVTFLRAAPSVVALPIQRGDNRILALRGREVLSTYRPGPDAPAFMTLLERTFGKSITTRTLETVARLAHPPVFDDEAVDGKRARAQGAGPHE